MSRVKLQRQISFVELRVMQHVALALEGLADDDARARVLNWACAHFNVPVLAAAHHDLAFGTIEELAECAEQHTGRSTARKPDRERRVKREVEPKSSGAISNWLKALRT